MPDPLDMTGRNVLVTGSGRNIGRAIILEYAGRGANVIVNARSDRDAAESVAEEARRFGVTALVAMGDASDVVVVASMRRLVESELGALDIYVSNAARRLYKDFFETTDDDWHRHLNMQLSASWYLAKAFVPEMRHRGWGRIIHMNGPDGWYGGHKRIPHSVAKGGLRTLTKGLARDLGPFGITVNDVVPGFVNTRRDPATHPQIDAAFTEAATRDIPIQRLVTTEEIAWTCLWLGSTRSGGVNGAAIHVDGGHRMLG